jgi:hypothetical protein
MTEDTDVENRLDELESLIERQQETIEAQRDRIDELESGADGDASDGGDDASGGGRSLLPLTRRELLGVTGTSLTGGLAGCPADPPDLEDVPPDGGEPPRDPGDGAGGGESPASKWVESDPEDLLRPASPYVGIDVTDVRTERLGGSLTGGPDITSLTGKGLTVTSGSLGVTVGEEIRDTLAARSEYDPAAGAKYLATDTGDVFLGDGEAWQPTFLFGRTTPGSLVFGPHNSAGNASGSVVSGGSENTADGGLAVVSGGGGNAAGGRWATVGGGQRNRASSIRTTIAGGGRNTAAGTASTVGGGDDNTATGTRATVGGGTGNTASGDWTTLAGGHGNAASGEEWVVGGSASFRVAGTNDPRIEPGDRVTLRLSVRDRPVATLEATARPG